MSTLFSIIRRAVVGTAVLLILLGVGFAAYLESTLPSVEMLKDMRYQVPLRVYSKDGKLIAEFGEAKRSPITLDQVPQDLINAVLATEDRRFYDHSGVDLRGLLRAGVHLMTNVSIKQGGSTITMQVARNYFLTRKKTFVRKLSEILLALKIEKEFSKDEILEMYLNKIYFGKRAYGVAAAAETYYGTTVDKLTLDQIAMLAGLPQAPSSVNPLHDKDAAYKRRKHVLDRMLSYDFITQAQYDQAVNAPLPTKYYGRSVELDAPYVAEAVRQELYNRYGEAVYTLGYEVYTTVTSEMQTYANAALRRALLEFDYRHGFRKPKQRLKASKDPKKQREDWLNQLAEIPAYGKLLPVAVQSFSGGKMVVLAQNGQTIDIPSSGYGWTRGLLSVGDVVFLQEILPKETPAKDKDKDKDPHSKDAHSKDKDPSSKEKSHKEAAPQPRTYKVVQVPEVSGAFVALNPQTGSIEAMVGGFDYSLSSFNRVTQAERQPGSNFKPFLYAAALNQGYTLASIFNDAPLTYVDPVTGVAWSPKNASGRFYGPTRLRVALKKSQNNVTVRLMQAVGVQPAIEFIQKFGFDPNRLPPVLSLALGVGTVTPLELARGYCTFANGGYLITPYIIHSIKDYQGNLIEDFAPKKPELVIKPQIAYLITSVLQDAIQSGTGVRAKALNRSDLAGKTGTTSEWMDAWFSGYNRDLMATAWVGFDEPRSTREYGSVAALPMWMYFMQEALKGKPEDPPPMPSGIVSSRIDPSSGRVTQGGIPELFIDDNVPDENSENEPAASYFDDDNDDSFSGIETLF